MLADRSWRTTRTPPLHWLRRTEPTLIVLIPYEHEALDKHPATEAHRLARLEADRGWPRGLASALLAYVDAAGLVDRE